MKAATTWPDFLTFLKKAPPLEYVHGMRHPVTKNLAHSVHSHSTIEIVYHAAGSGRVQLPEGRTVHFPERGVVIHAPMEAHDQIMDCDGEDICIHIAIPNRTTLRAASSLCIERIDSLAVLADIEFLGKAHHCPDPVEKVILNLRATSLLMALLRQSLQMTAIRNAPQADEHYVLSAERYMMESYQTIDTMRQVAENTGIGYDHLRHLFKSLRGKSLIRHLNEIRVGQAKSHLVYSRLPIKQIATLCGFRDEYYFSAVFRKFEGLSPAQYRRVSIERDYRN